MNNCFSIYRTSEQLADQRVTIPTKAILFFFGCSEVNSTWLITSELANQRARKVLFTCVAYTKYKYVSTDLCEAYNRTGEFQKCRYLPARVWLATAFLLLQLRSTKIILWLYLGGKDCVIGCHVTNGNKGLSSNLQMKSEPRNEVE